MLFGSRNILGIEILPVSPSWETRYDPERTAWAALSIWAGGTNLCEHTMPGEERIQASVYVPLGPIADWFVRSWPAICYEEKAREHPTSADAFGSLSAWAQRSHPAHATEDQWDDLREAWWRRHFVHAGADGAFLPNVALVREDDRLIVSWSRAKFAGSPAPDFKATPASTSLSWEQGREAITEFVTHVASLYSADGPYAWCGRSDPFEHDDWLARVCLYTGRLPEELEQMADTSDPSAIARKLGLPSTTDDPAASTVTQILRDLSPTRAPADLKDLLDDLDQRTRRVGPSFEALRRDARESARTGTTAEQEGQVGAQLVRSGLDLDGAPVDDLPAVLATLGLILERPGVPGVRERMVLGARHPGSALALALDTHRTATEWGYRFEGARALGHILLDEARSGCIGAASSPFAQAHRRRRSGAFAAELLLPHAALAEASGHTLDGAADPATLQRLMSRYGVGAKTTCYQLWNHGWLSSPELRDDLIEEHATAP
jgi:hypothetical protein